MGIKRFLFLALLFSSLYAAEVCFFIPPKNWEVADPKKLAPRVHICFLGNSSKGLSPSINLATESIPPISLETYTKIVKKSYAANPNYRWRDLGTFKTLLGEGKLTEIEFPMKLGMMRLVQLILVKNQIAYILTAGALKEEFPKYYKTFDTALRSLQSSSNLMESYPSQSHQITLQQLVQSLENEFALLLRTPELSSLTPSLAKRSVQKLPQTPSSFYKTPDQVLRSLQLHSGIKSHFSLSKQAILQKAKNRLTTAEQKTPSPEELFQSETFQELSWKPFEQKITHDFTEMGPYWQILLLKEVQVKLLTTRTK